MKTVNTLNIHLPADICKYIPWRQAKRCTSVLFILLVKSLCESNLEVAYCLFYMQHALGDLCFHAKTKKRRAPWFHKPTLRELHWPLSIVIEIFSPVWASECGSLVCYWLLTCGSNRSKCLNLNFSRVDTQGGIVQTKQLLRAWKAHFQREELWSYQN